MPLLEIDTVYKRGIRSYIHTFVEYGWWLTAIGLTLLYLSYAMYWGPLVDTTVRFLAQFPTLYITNDMLALWVFLTAISFIFVAYLRANVMFRQYKFTLDEHAFRLQRGLFRIREYTFPYAQISNVHIEQPYHWRLLGLASLDIISASDTFDHNAKKKQDTYLIPLIDKKVAKQIRLQIMRYGSGEGSPTDDMYEEVEDETEYESEEGADSVGDQYEEDLFINSPHMQPHRTPASASRAVDTAGGAGDRL
jgi:membrane protein YdbS with pleckstrin-like domain